MAAAVERDWETAPLDPRRRAIADYAAKLTRTPSAMAAQDLEPMRTAGLSDVDMLHVAEVTAYYAYVNRIASGLGVELEPDD